MKYLLFVTALLYSNISLACTCNPPPSLCEFSKLVENSQDGIIFIGEFIKVDSLDLGREAYQFRLLDLIRGEVVTNSVLYNDPNYFNTDSTIWLVGGDSAGCLHRMSGKSLFVTTYQQGDYGYVPDICTPSYFKIDDDNMIEGDIWKSEERIKYSIDDLEDVLTSTCITRTEEVRNYLKSATTIFPNPTFDKLTIELDVQNSQKLNYTIVNLLGKEMEHGILEKRERIFSLREYPEGIYILSIELDGVPYSTRIIKGSSF